MLARSDSICRNLASASQLALKDLDWGLGLAATMFTWGEAGFTIAKLFLPREVQYLRHKGEGHRGLAPIQPF